jgi:hypothetical protein
VPIAAQLAQDLVEYDEVAARKLYEVIIADLGGRLDTAPPERERVTTMEWKMSLASYERLRSLGRELERLLQ